MAGPLPSAAVVDRVQARPRRPQDDRGFRPAGAEPGAAAAAADPDRRRYPRGRARACGTSGSGTLLRTLFEAAEERLRLGHKQHGRAELVEAPAEGARRRAGLEGERGPRACAAPARQLLAGRAARLAARQRPAGRGGRSAYRRCASRTSSPRTIRTAARPGSASSPPTARACSTASAPASRRPERTSSMRASTRRAMAWRSTICWCSTARGKAYSDAPAAQPAGPARSRRRLTSAGAAAAPPRRERGQRRARAFGSRRRSRSRTALQPHHGGRGQCARPAGAARRAGRGDPRRRATSIHSAHIATYGERAVDVFYLTRGRRAEARRPATIERLRSALLDAASGAPRAEPPEEEGPRR